MRKLDTTIIIGALLVLGFLLTALAYQMRKKQFQKIILKNVKTTQVRMPKITSYKPEVAEVK